MFSLDLEDGRLLAVFGCEESAEWFLYHVPGRVFPGQVEDEKSKADAIEADAIETGAIAEDGWRVRAVGVGELLSLLSGSAFAAGPCTGVEKVILDPPLEVFDRAGREDRLIGESRARFLKFLMGRETSPERLESGGHAQKA